MADCTWLSGTAPAKMAEVARRSYLQLEAALPSEVGFVCVHDLDTAVAFGLTLQQPLALRTWTGETEVGASTKDCRLVSASLGAGCCLMVWGLGLCRAVTRAYFLVGLVAQPPWSGRAQGYGTVDRGAVPCPCAHPVDEWASAWQCERMTRLQSFSLACWPNTVVISAVHGCMLDEPGQAVLIADGRLTTVSFAGLRDTFGPPPCAIASPLARLAEVAFNVSLLVISNKGSHDTTL